MTPAIHIEGLGKCYRISHESSQRRGHKTLRETLSSLAAAPFNRFRNGGRTGKQEEFWALKDIHFDVNPGEVVGIIGGNGAGKSTLLKILSRITKPTNGVVTLNGRVASLLEVGTGFHPELTGRENIYLNGAILGMNKSDIDRRFNDIVEFSEIKNFLDTPVKHYSSGMYVRLAFSVAAHLEPEILIIDEVLAVGDAEFQRKCLGKMQEASNKQGRTVLFVSHNMAAIQMLCSRAILLSKGKFVMSGTPEEVANLYLSQHISPENEWRLENPDEKSGNKATILGIRVENTEGIPESYFNYDKDIYLSFHIRVNTRISDCQVAVRVMNSSLTPVFTTSDSDESINNTCPRDPGYYHFRIKIPKCTLYPGRHTIIVAVHNPCRDLYDVNEGSISFNISDIRALRFFVIDEKAWSMSNANGLVNKS